MVTFRFLDFSLATWNATLSNQVVISTAAALHLDPSRINIVDVSQGSVIVVLSISGLTHSQALAMETQINTGTFVVFPGSFGSVQASAVNSAPGASGMNPGISTTLVIIIVAGVVGLVLVIIGMWLYCNRRRSARAHAQPEVTFTNTSYGSIFGGSQFPAFYKGSLSPRKEPSGTNQQLESANSYLIPPANRRSTSEYVDTSNPFKLASGYEVPVSSPVTPRTVRLRTIALFTTPSPGPLSSISRRFC